VCVCVCVGERERGRERVKESMLCESCMHTSTQTTFDEHTRILHMQKHNRHLRIDKSNRYIFASIHKSNRHIFTSREKRAEGRTSDASEQAAAKAFASSSNSACVMDTIFSLPPSLSLSLAQQAATTAFSASTNSACVIDTISRRPLPNGNEISPGHPRNFAQSWKTCVVFTNKNCQGAQSERTSPNEFIPLCVERKKIEKKTFCSA
jgi:hypothetical protein